MRETMRLALVIAWRDLRMELRSRTAIIGALVFAALVLVVFNFARDPTAVATIDIAPSVLWITFAFAGTVALNRAFTVERQHGAFDGLLRSAASRGRLRIWACASCTWWRRNDTRHPRRRRGPPMPVTYLARPWFVRT